jgi:3',5'-cyclic AMP phosphodiesterase CpdA
MTRSMRTAVPLLAIGLVALAGLAVDGEPATWPASGPTSRATGASEPFFFIQMADPQLGFFSGGEDFTKETELFEKAIAHANRLKPAFVVISGDLVNGAGNARQIAEFKRICAKLDKSIPLHLVCGNHDIGGKPNAAAIDRYRRAFGPDRYSFRCGGAYGIVLNTQIVKSPQNVPQEAPRQLAWLKAELAKAAASRAENILVFTHHPLFLDRPDEPEQYFNLPVKDRQAYLTLLRAYGVRAVFAGHHHRNSLARDGKMEMITTGPVGKPLGKDPSGLRIVKVYADRIEHAYYGLDSVPESVRLTRGPAR